MPPRQAEPRNAQYQQADEEEHGDWPQALEDGDDGMLGHGRRRGRVRRAENAREHGMAGSLLFHSRTCTPALSVPEMNRAQSDLRFRQIFDNYDLKQE
jgi:hypothetical protein